MRWPGPFALALGLLALGRVFMLRTVFATHLRKELVPYRVTDPANLQQPLPRHIYNPQLGRTLCEILFQVARFCGRREWSAAQEWCNSALQVKDLPAVYRGEINVELANGVARYYLAVVWIGEQKTERAIQALVENAEQLAFTLPDTASPQWLAIARIYAFQKDIPNALWALEKSAGLTRECLPSTTQVLYPLIEAAYWHIAPSYRK